MSPAAAPAPLPTRSEIEEWDTSYLNIAASAWRQTATASEDAFGQHRQNISSPGGTTWEGDARDAALDRVTKDLAVVGRQSDVLREAAGLAENGSHDIKAAKDKAVEAITAAVDDGFNVAEDLSVTDSRKYDMATIADRNKAATEHAEDIRWAAEQLMHADKLVGDRLEEKAADLEAIRFDGEDNGRNSHVSLVDNKVKHDAEGNDRPGEKKPETPAQAPGQLGPFAVPRTVEDAAKRSGAKPDSNAPGPETQRAPGSLEDMLLPAGKADPKALASDVDPNSREGKEISAARESLIASGRSPEEVERTINNIFGGANEKYTPPDGPKPPRPALDEGAGDTLRGTEDFVHDLLGQDGMESFKDAWKGVGSNLLETAKDPYGTLVRGVGDDFHDAVDNPAYWAGGKLAEAGIAGATAPLGPEALAARGALDDVVRSGLPHEAVHAPPHVDAPTPPVEHPAPMSADETVRTSPDAGGGYAPHNPADHSTPVDIGDRPVVPAPDGLDHHAPIGPWLPPSVDDIRQWLPDINHGPGMDPFDPARAVNCGQCALAVDQRLTGALPDASAGLGTLSIPEMEAATGLRQVPATPLEIEQYLINQGAGAHTVIGVDRAGAAGHWFNAYYDGTKVYAVDGQTGDVVGWPPNMDFPGHPVMQWDMGVQK